MQLSIPNELLMSTLQLVLGAINKKHDSMPILSNVLIRIQNNQLVLIGSDLEVEIIATTTIEQQQPDIEFTVSAHKLMEICRSSNTQAMVIFTINAQRISLAINESKFNLASLAAADYPELLQFNVQYHLQFKCADFKRLLQNTDFSMAKGDIRYYLNGLMLEVESHKLRAVTTDGHRLSLSEFSVVNPVDEIKQFIIPAKGISEIKKMLLEDDSEIVLEIDQRHLRLINATGGFSLTTKLIEGRFPDYRRVIPQKVGSTLMVSRDSLLEAVHRVAILSNDDNPGLRILLENDRIQLTANNPDQEMAEEWLAAQYDGEHIEVGFNIQYLKDALQAVKTDLVCIIIINSENGVVIRGNTEDSSIYVVMPMRI